MAAMEVMDLVQAMAIGQAMAVGQATVDLGRMEVRVAMEPINYFSECSEQFMTSDDFCKLSTSALGPQNIFGRA